MNVDEAMEKWKHLRGLYDMPEWPRTAMDVLIAEVERLRAELAAAKAASFDVEEDEQDHEAIEIFGMSHFYGSLWITKKGEEYFWFLDDYNGGEWKPITKRLHNTRDQRARKGKHEFRK